MRLHRLLWAYWQTRRRRFESRAALEDHQQRQLARFEKRVLSRSPYFRPWLGRPLSGWPIMDKAGMMQHFDRLNTAGLRLDQVLACALEAERTRDFGATVGRFSVGLSSGTSGRRGVFVVSPEEQARWAGVLLAKLLPHGLRRGERVALFLRADSNLYRAVRTPWLSFRFFDLFQPFDAHLPALDAYAPTIVAAPAQVLRALALARLDGRLRHAPGCVISAAEVLDPLDRALLQHAFGTVREVYQATEGFLAASCAHGSLHLNEDVIHVEPQWLDADRFVPLITDFSRSTQPIVRYRLDDVLVRRGQPCPCGSPLLALDRIEGRRDDMLILPGRDGRPVTVFADVCSRALAQCLPLTADYRLLQRGEADLLLAVDAGDTVLAACRDHLQTVFGRLGVDPARLRWTLSGQVDAAVFTVKRRRILRLPAAEGPA